jgi:SAM-dependent methyltransferase
MRARTPLVSARAALLALALAGCQRERSAAAQSAATAAATLAAAADAPHDSIVPRAAPGAPAVAFPAPTRRVAAIIAPRWSSEDARDDAGEAERVMQMLDVRPGMAVADVGAGDGYYTVRLADRVGAGGRVYGQDIVPEYLRELQQRVRDNGRANVTLVLGEPHDPRLPAASVDLVLMVHMYHEIDQPFGLLYNLYPSLRAGARVAVLDLNRPPELHGTPPALLRCELESMGYRRDTVHTVSPGEYLAVFRPPATREALTAPEDVVVRLATNGCGTAPR